MNKKASLLLFFILIIIIISGCSSSFEEFKLSKQSEKYVLNYIYKKYSIKPKVISSEVETSCVGICVSYNSADYIGIVYNMKYKNKDFKVYFYDKKHIADDYQANKIKQDFINYIIKKYNIEKPYSYNLYFKNDTDIDSNDNDTFTDYYDGNNLEKILDTYTIYFRFDYLKDFDLLKVKDLPSSFEKIDGEFIIYNSFDDYNKNKKLNGSLISMENYGEPLYINKVLDFYEGSDGISFKYHVYGDIKKLDVPYTFDSYERSSLDVSDKLIVKSNDLSSIDIDSRHSVISPLYTINYSNILNSENLKYNNIYMYLDINDLDNYNKDVNYAKMFICYKEDKFDVKYKYLEPNSNVEETVIDGYLRININLRGYEDCDKVNLIIVKKKK